MRYPWRGALLVASCVGICLSLLPSTGYGSIAQAQSPRNLRSLGLRVSDLLPQTTLDSARFWTNAQAAQRDRVPLTTYKQHGRVLSYQDSFSRHVINGSGTIWLLHADSEITAFQSEAGAGWYYDQLRADMKKAYVSSTNNLGANAGQTGIHVPFRPVAIPVIGAEDAGYTVNSGGDEMGYTTRVILFQQGRYVVMLRIMGLLDETVLSRVVAVARKIDARVRTA